MRPTCTITLTAEEICWRIAFSGMLRLAIATIVSRRYSASRGLLAWIVVKTPVVAGIHRLQHVERFFAADLADDDAVGPHTEGVDDELALPDGALALDVGGAGLETHHMALTQLQFRRILDRHDALVIVDEA